MDIISLRELHWWIDNISSAWAPIHHALPSDVITVDASKRGWGASYHGIRTNGHFSVNEQGFSINTKETLAILYGLRSFHEHLRDNHLLIKSDNSTAISFVKKMGGMSSELRDKIAKDLWNFAIVHHLWLSITYIPSKENIEADVASRFLNKRTEWALELNIFQDICNFFGTPEDDLFASRLNNKLPHYFSWTPDPFTKHVDSFLIDWDPTVLYFAFPPFSLITKVLNKILTEGSTVVFVFPAWDTQSWIPLLIQLLISPLVIIPGLPIYLPFQPGYLHPLQSSLRLCCAKLSGQMHLIQEFQSGLQRCYSEESVGRLFSNTIRHSNDIHYFAHRGVFIPIHQLPIT